MGARVQKPHVKSHDPDSTPPGAKSVEQCTVIDAHMEGDGSVQCAGGGRDGGPGGLCGGSGGSGGSNGGETVGDVLGEAVGVVLGATLGTTLGDGVSLGCVGEAVGEALGDRVGASEQGCAASQESPAAAALPSKAQ